MNRETERLKEEILHELCGVCVHKPTSIEDGLFEDSPKTLHGCGCSYDYDEESNQYCVLAHKYANAILRKCKRGGLCWYDGKRDSFVEIEL